MLSCMISTSSAQIETIQEIQDFVLSLVVYNVHILFVRAGFFKENDIFSSSSSACFIRW